MVQGLEGELHIYLPEEFGGAELNPIYQITKKSEEITFQVQVYHLKIIQNNSKPQKGIAITAVNGLDKKHEESYTNTIADRKRTFL